MNYYDEIATGYEELHRQEQETKIEIIKKHIKIKPTDKLLDVGCGTGLTTIPWDCKLYGLDPSKKLLEKAKLKSQNKTKNITWVNATAEKIPFKDNYFDIVISVTAIQNFDNLEKGLDEIKRVGKNRFVLTFLKASLRNKEISDAIENKFNIKKSLQKENFLKIEEEKDLIYICN